MEAVFYGAFSSNHGDLADAYVQTILDFVPAARQLAAAQSRKLPMDAERRLQAFHYFETRKF